jgi:7SK snRNA methylphosphate capping enzyme
LSLGASPRPSKRKTRCFRYGNYHRYYGYRVGETLEDHRVAHFRDEWFAGKRVLDVGCNEGLVGLSIAVRCKPAKMLGVDIDPHLVKKAREKLARLKRAAERLARERKEDERMTEKEDGTKSNASVEAGVASVANDTPHDPIADDARPQSENENENENTHEDALADAAEALNAVSFSRCDVTAPDEDERNKGLFARESLDAVLCLSVTKWIQLNWGDAGLKRLFMDVHESLTPGGVFIVEPQPWRSYRQAFRKQHMPEETKAHFRAIALRPSLYAEFLRTAVGFERVTTLRDADMHDASEFDRTVLLCVKKSADVGG